MIRDPWLVAREMREMMKVKDYKTCAELETQLIIAAKRNYITQEKLEELSEDLNHESRMIINMFKNISLRSQ